MMEKNSRFQEVILGSKDPKISNQISLLVKKGLIRKIAPRIYSSNFTDSIEIIIRRNIFEILGKLYPRAILSHRTAFEFQPTPSGLIFLTTSYTKKVKLPGITLQFLAGEGPIFGDHLFTGDLRVSQSSRAFLENLQVSKKVNNDSKCLPLVELEERLEQIIRVNGEDEINRVKDLARKISVQLNMPKEFEKLGRLISALLSTKPSSILNSEIARARAFGHPFDPARVVLFEKLFLALKKSAFKYQEERNTSSKSFRNFAFFESYFSNYIEGTVFQIEEAKLIIQTNKPLPSRKEESHDVLGTFHIVSNRIGMELTPNTADELITILRQRHSILLGARIDKNPGIFKTQNNFAGNTAFVDYNLVKGTLIKSFDYYHVLEHPFSKAAYIMFVVSEVHPFLDGNGRLARIMMNAELVKAGQSKIIIPTVYREDYMGALKKLTRQGRPEAFIRMLQRAHEFSANVHDDEFGEMQTYLEKCQSFSDDSEDILRISKRDGS